MQAADGPGGGAGAARHPAGLRAAGLLVLLEGAGLALLGVGYAASGLLGTPEDRLAVVLAGAFALVVGLGLVAVGRALGQARGWALAPTVVTQVFGSAVAVGLVQAGVHVVAVPVLLAAAGVLVGLVTRTSRAALGGAS